MKKYLIFLLAVCTACSAQNRMISSMETAESSRSEEESSLIETAQKTEETPVTEETAEGIDIDAYTGNWEGLVDVLSMKETSENVYEADGLTVSWEYNSYYPDFRIFTVQNTGNRDVLFCGSRTGDSAEQFDQNVTGHGWYRAYDLNEAVMYAKYIGDQVYVLTADIHEEKVKSYTISNEVLDGSVYAALDKVYFLQNHPDMEEWKKAYITYIADNHVYHVYDEPVSTHYYGFTDINGDEIPELHLYYDNPDYGEELITYTEEGLKELHLYGKLLYYKGENYFADSSDISEVHQDAVYAINNGDFENITNGNYGTDDPEHSDYRYYCNGEEVSESEYKKYVIDGSRCAWANNELHDYYEMMMQIVMY